MSARSRSRPAPPPSWPPRPPARPIPPVAGTGGAGSGISAIIATDANGVATARLSAAGNGLSAPATHSPSPTRPPAARTVTMKLRNAASPAIGRRRHDLAGRQCRRHHDRRAEDQCRRHRRPTPAAQHIALGAECARSLAAPIPPTSHKTGKITLATSDSPAPLVSWPIDFTAKNAAIDHPGRDPRGGAIKINATAKDTNLASDAPSAAAGFASTLTDPAEQIPGRADQRR